MFLGSSINYRHCITLLRDCISLELVCSSAYSLFSLQRAACLHRYVESVVHRIEKELQDHSGQEEPTVDGSRFLVTSRYFARGETARGGTTNCRLVSELLWLSFSELLDLYKQRGSIGGHLSSAPCTYRHLRLKERE